MKKRFYLSALLSLSILSTLNRIYVTFLVPFRDLSGNLTGDAEIDAFLSESSLLAEKQYAFATSYSIRILVIAKAISLLVSLFYLIKRDVKAIYIYLVYLLMTLAKSVCDFIVVGSFVHLYSDEMMQSTVRTGSKTNFGFSLALFLIYILIIYANNKTKSSVKNMPSAGIDI